VGLYRYPGTPHSAIPKVRACVCLSGTHHAWKPNASLAFCHAFKCGTEALELHIPEQLFNATLLLLGWSVCVCAPSVFNCSSNYQRPVDVY